MNERRFIWMMFRNKYKEISCRDYASGAEGRAKAQFRYPAYPSLKAGVIWKYHLPGQLNSRNSRFLSSPRPEERAYKKMLSSSATQLSLLYNPTPVRPVIRAGFRVGIE